MAAIVSLNRVSLGSKAQAWNLAIYAGDRYVVMGRAASGKSRLLEVAAGRTKPASGTVSTVDVDWAAPPGLAIRGGPQAVAQRVSGRSNPTAVARALSACGLWDVRKTPYARLSDSQKAACELLPVLLGSAPLGLIDGQLDHTDPWAVSQVLELIHELPKALLIVTHRPEIAAHIGGLIVLKSLSPVFIGSSEELRKGAGMQRFEISTEDKTTARTMLQPFALTIEETERGLLVQAPPNQETAAKLLLHGYGSVDALLLRQKTLEEALLEIL